jgi:hypothetical protein
MTDFLVTKEVIDDIPILIVDIEQQYLEEEDVYGLIREEYHEEVKLELRERMDTVYERLKLLDNKLFTVHHTPLYEKISSLPITDLNEWLIFTEIDSNKTVTYNEYLKKVENDYYYGLFVNSNLHPNVTQEFKETPKVLVCGLWKDRCVFQVTKLLNENGIMAILFDNDDYTIGSEVIGDGYSLFNLAKDHQLQLKYLTKMEV